MKKIVLIGDSIRLGYGRYIKEAFSGVAEVYAPEDNCKYAQNVIRYAHEWKNMGSWPDDIDVVHWNAGLWDVLRLYDDEPLTPKEFYGGLIKRIDKILRLLFPKAKFVFATSTAVQEEKYTDIFKRYNADIIEYNKIALDALKDTDTVINDLFSITINAPETCCSDMTHFNTSEGVKLVGGKVKKVLCEVLGVDNQDLIDAKTDPNKISDRILGF